MSRHHSEHIEAECFVCRQQFRSMAVYLRHRFDQEGFAHACVIQPSYKPRPSSPLAKSQG